MYLKYEAIPTLTSWDYANVTTRSSSAIIITDAQYGNWYVRRLFQRFSPNFTGI